MARFSHSIDNNCKIIYEKSYRQHFLGSILALIVTILTIYKILLESKKIRLENEKLKLEIKKLKNKRG